jgi:hypothetical protein
MKTWHRVAIAVLVTVLAVAGVVAYLETRTEYQVMSVSGYALRLEDGTGTEIFAVTDAGNTDVAGTLNADGAATLNSTLDVDGNLSSGTGAVTVTDDLNVTGALQYGSNSLYPLAYASQSYEIQCGSEVITGANQTVTVSDITTVTFGIAALGSDPGTGAGDPWFVTVDAPDGTSGDIVVNVWQDDASAATAGGTVQWCAIGNE